MQHINQNQVIVYRQYVVAGKRYVAFLFLFVYLCFFRLCQRQAYGEAASLVRFAFHTDVSFQQFHGIGHDSKPQSEAVFRHGVAQPFKRGEYPLLLFPCHARACCDLLKNSYLCLLNNTCPASRPWHRPVVICWKIRIFAYWTTPPNLFRTYLFSLWFAEKFVSLLIEQHHKPIRYNTQGGCDLLKNSYLCLLNNTKTGYANDALPVVICWKIRIFAYWTTPKPVALSRSRKLWFAEKFVSLLIEQHPVAARAAARCRCDLLKNSYLCLLNNTNKSARVYLGLVVICWKIRIFAYWTTPRLRQEWLKERCDLLKNSYLCLLNNTLAVIYQLLYGLWFAEKFVSLLIEQHHKIYIGVHKTGCDLLKNSYLCLLNNTRLTSISVAGWVVICWKIRIFAYWTTPRLQNTPTTIRLWFAEKFVSLLIEQHPIFGISPWMRGCDLLKNSYLCLLNNTGACRWCPFRLVVICWKIRIFAYWTTPSWRRTSITAALWFAEKFVSLLIEQHRSASKDVAFSSCDLLKNSYLCLLNNTRIL